MMQTRRWARQQPRSRRVCAPITRARARNLAQNFNAAVQLQQAQSLGSVASRGPGHPAPSLELVTFLKWLYIR